MSTPERRHRIFLATLERALLELRDDGDDVEVSIHVEPAPPDGGPRSACIALRAGDVHLMRDVEIPAPACVAALVDSSLVA